MFCFNLPELDLIAWYEMIFTSDNDAAHLEDNAKHHIDSVIHGMLHMYKLFWFAQGSNYGNTWHDFLMMNLTALSM